MSEEEKLEAIRQEVKVGILVLIIGCLCLIVLFYATKCSETKSKPAGKFGPPPEGVEEPPYLEGLGPMKEKD